MENCCRICRRQYLINPVSLDYHSEHHNDTILTMIQSITGLATALEDRLPQQICRVCMGSLLAGYELRQLCIESYAYFQDAFQTDSQGLTTTETFPSDEHDGNDLESCLTLEQIKLEPFGDGEEMVTDPAPLITGHGYKENGTEDKFYCCFPNCGVNYQFKELLIEHAASDHQLEKEANAAKCKASEFCCIVCAKTFRNEIKLLEHRNRKKTAMLRCSYCEYQTESKALYREHIRAHNKKEKRCDCGFKTHLKFSFKRHQAICVPSRRRPYRQQTWNALKDHIADDKTNDEIKAMGFALSHKTNVFYCCVSHCATVCETQQQLSDHFQVAHPEVREENMKNDSGDDIVFRCPICFRGLPTKKALQIHLEDAYAPSYRCNTCRYVCNSRKSAILHASVPCLTKMHRCSCGYATLFLHSIKRHVQSSGCPREGSTLKFIKTRRTKTKKEAGPRKQILKCKYCDKSFTTVENLQKHMESELSFALAKQEERAPGKEIEGSEYKQYTCCWCNAITTDVNHLVLCMIHSSMIASQDEEYKCTKCDDSFKTYNQYVEHTTNRVCSVESWLSCKHCGDKFPNKNILVQHVGEMHGAASRTHKAKQYECKDCLQRYVTLFSLNRHRKKLHNALPEKANRVKK